MSDDRQKIIELKRERIRLKIRLAKVEILLTKLQDNTEEHF